jgi:hypothetical protein
MKMVKDFGILLVSIYYLFFGAYNILYSRILFTAISLTSCSGTDCLMLVFLKMLALILGTIGFVYMLTAVLIRFRAVGCKFALVASAFNIILMLAYLLKPDMLPIWLTFVLPLRVIFTESISYSPAQAADFLSLLGGFLEVIIIVVNIGIAFYLLKCLDRKLWDE